MAGDEFEASDKDAKLLKIIGKAEDQIVIQIFTAPSKEPEKAAQSKFADKTKYKTRHLVAEE